MKRSFGTKTNWTTKVTLPSDQVCVNSTAQMRKQIMNSYNIMIALGSNYYHKMVLYSTDSSSSEAPQNRLTRSDSVEITTIHCTCPCFEYSATEVVSLTKDVIPSSSTSHPITGNTHIFLKCLLSSKVTEKLMYGLPILTMLMSI